MLLTARLAQPSSPHRRLATWQEDGTNTLRFMWPRHLSLRILQPIHLEHSKQSHLLPDALPGGGKPDPLNQQSVSAHLPRLCLFPSLSVCSRLISSSSLTFIYLFER